MSFMKLLLIMCREIAPTIAGNGKEVAVRLISAMESDVHSFRKLQTEHVDGSLQLAGFLEL